MGFNSAFKGLKWLLHSTFWRLGNYRCAGRMLEWSKGYETYWDGSYVYWTVHHLDSWIKRDQLHVTRFFISLFNAQHVSDVNTSILRSLRLICWVIAWVVLLWFDACGIRMQAEALVLQPASGYHTIPAKPQCNTNTHRTRVIQPMK